MNVKLLDVRLPLWISILVIVIAMATVAKGVDSYTKYLRGTMTVYYADDIKITEFRYDGHNGCVNMTLTYENGGTGPNCTVTITQGENVDSVFVPASEWNGTVVCVSVPFEMTKGVMVIEVTTP